MVCHCMSLEHCSLGQDSFALVCSLCPNLITDPENLKLKREDYSSMLELSNKMKRKKGQERECKGLV